MEARRSKWPQLPDLTRNCPVIPVARLDGYAMRNVTLFPFTPAIAGNLDCISANRASGLIVWVSEWQARFPCTCAAATCASELTMPSVAVTCAGAAADVLRGQPE